MQKKEELKESRQYKKDCKDKRFTNNVPLTWCVRFDLTPLELITYCVIRDATVEFEQEAYTGSVKGLCAKTNVSRPTQIAALKVLYDKGFVYRKIAPYNGRNIVAYVAYTFDKNKNLEEQLETFKTQNQLRKTNFRG